MRNPIPYSLARFNPLAVKWNVCHDSRVMQNQIRTIAQEISSRLVAIRNCEQSNNQEWLERHSATLKDLIAELPGGSGIDCGTKLDRDASHGEKLVLLTSFHHMNENGMYDGWTEHKVIVTPSFSGLDIRITGRDRNEIKEYLHEVYYIALSASVPARVFEKDKVSA